MATRRRAADKQRGRGQRGDVMGEENSRRVRRGVENHGASHHEQSGGGHADVTREGG